MPLPEDVGESDMVTADARHIQEAGAETHVGSEEDKLHEPVVPDDVGVPVRKGQELQDHPKRHD